MLGVMSEPGWASCYVFVEGRSPEQVAALFGGHLAGPLLSAREADTPTAPWPSVGPAGGRWTMVIDPHFEFDDRSDDDLAPGSVGTRIVRLAVIEREWFSHTKVWVDGRAAWEVSFEGELDDRPLVGGRFPYDLDEFARAISWPGCKTTRPAIACPSPRLRGWSAGAGISTMASRTRPDSLDSCTHGPRVWPLRRRKTSAAQSRSTSRGRLLSPSSEASWPLPQGLDR
jgi:hypothetical protein